MKRQDVVNHWKAKVALLLLLLFPFSCAKENPNLVNPPTVFETVVVRFLNLAGDEQPRSLVLDKTLRFNNVAYDAITQAEMPPFDSVYVDVYKGDSLEYSKEAKQKFARNTRYVFIALPSPAGASDYRNVDTMLALQTTIVKPNDTNECYVKMLNANPDTSVSYSLRLGCPSDSMIFNSMRYCQSSGVYAIYKGKRVFSVVKNIANTSNPDSMYTYSELVGIYELNLINLGQYAFIIDKDEKVYFLDELSPSANPLVELMPIDGNQREAYIRVANLSSGEISINKVPGSTIVSNLNPNFINDNYTVSACDNVSKDKLRLEYNGAVTDSAYTSFDIHYTYTAMAFDSKHAQSNILIVVPPVRDLRKNRAGKAVVQVVNANYDSSGITVSIGARSASNIYGYESGQVMAAGLSAKKVSAPAIIDAGTVPIVVFTSTEPAKYLFSANVVLEKDRNYIIAVDCSGEDGRIAAIEEQDNNMAVEYAASAAYLQIINAVTGLENVSVACGNILASANLEYGNSLATFVPEGTNTVSVNGHSHSFNADKTKRILLIASNSGTVIDIYDIQSPPMGATATDYRRRFINASADVATLQVKPDSTSTPLAENIQYKGVSDVERQTREQKFALYFYDQGSGKKLAVFSDLLMTLRKNYSVIFYGEQKKGYNILILQEY